MTTLSDATRPRASQRRELGRYVPRRYNDLTRERFLRDRRRRYLARIAGDGPTDCQAALIQSLAALEWAALSAEDEGSQQGFREAREHRRLFQRLLADFERSVAEAAARKPKMPTLAEHLARRAAERDAAA